MAVLELYGKCKELGYCDCKGFWGCVDPRPPAPKPVIENELKTAMRAENQLSDYTNSNYRRELAEIEEEESAGLVECEVCEKSHPRDHPHITNIEGDVPIDDSEPLKRKQSPVIFLPPPEEQLPERLREKSDKNEQMCKLCGKPWAPRHNCNPAVATATKNRVTPYHSRHYAKCDVCGKKQQRNHKCNGRPNTDDVKSVEICEDCKHAGELCVRHGGAWSAYDTPRGGEQIARKLPKPTSVTMPADSVMESEKTHNCRKGHPRTPENTYIRSDGRLECKECKKFYRSTGSPAVSAETDPELAAIGTILRAVEGLESKQLKRVMSYVAARLEEAA